MLSSEDVLFLGKGLGAISWYRCGQPAFYSGCDYAAVVDRPPNLQLVTALKRGGMELPKFENYRIIVVQQPQGTEWMGEIFRWQGQGVKVLYELDDDLSSVRKQQGHAAAKIFDKKTVKNHEKVMRICDGMIVSTEFLKRRYRSINKNIFVCNNAIERERFRPLGPPERDTINIGWAGGEGHQSAVEAWIPAIQRILDEYSSTRFITIGAPYSELCNRPERTLSLPPVYLENYPGALCNFDIALGPAGSSNFYRAKSDLRWLETGALSIPLVGDPDVYSYGVHQKDIVHASTSDEAYDGMKALLDSPDDRDQIGAAARYEIFARRSIEEQVEQWERVFVEVANGN